MQISQQEEISPSLQQRAKLPILTDSKKVTKFINPDRGANSIF